MGRSTALVCKPQRIFGAGDVRYRTRAAPGPAKRAVNILERPLRPEHRSRVAGARRTHSSRLHMRPLESDADYCVYTHQSSLVIDAALGMVARWSREPGAEGKAEQLVKARSADRRGRSAVTRSIPTREVSSVMTLNFIDEGQVCRQPPRSPASHPDRSHSRSTPSVSR
jgi:hypothetical protein